jgi:hypothetical protein
MTRLAVVRGFNSAIAELELRVIALKVKLNAAIAARAVKVAELRTLQAPLAVWNVKIEVLNAEVDPAIDELEAAEAALAVAKAGLAAELRQ